MLHIQFCLSTANLPAVSVSCVWSANSIASAPSILPNSGFSLLFKDHLNLERFQQMYFRNEKQNRIIYIMSLDVKNDLLGKSFYLLMSLSEQIRCSFIRCLNEK